MAEPFELKPLSKSAVAAALQKAEHYRLLNEPRQAESICLDVLRVDAENQKAIVTLVLALSDQLERRKDMGVRQAREYLGRLSDAYQKAYYEGILCERRAYTVMKTHRPGSQHTAYNWFRMALDKYREAEKHKPEGNDEVFLRWNTVVRMLRRHPELQPEPEVPRTEHMLE